MSDLGTLVQEGLGQALVAVAPLLAAGLLGSIVAGWLAARMGLRDPVMTGVLRGLCVLWALVTTADALGAEATRLASETWSGLAAVGRGEIPSPESTGAAEGSAASPPAPAER